MAKSSKKSTKAAAGAVLSTNRVGNYIGMTGDRAACLEACKKNNRARQVAVRGGSVAASLKAMHNHPKWGVAEVFGPILTADQKTRYEGVKCGDVAKRSDMHGEFTIIDAVAMADIFKFKDYTHGGSTTSATSILRKSLFQMGASVENGAKAGRMKAGTTRWNLPGFGLHVNPENYPVMSTPSLRKKALKKGGLWQKRGRTTAKYSSPYY